MMPAGFSIPMTVESDNLQTANDNGDQGSSAVHDVVTAIQEEQAVVGKDSGESPSSSESSDDSDNE